MKFIIDTEKINGELGYGELFVSPNEKYGYRPFELFVSSLAGCSGTLLRNILTKKRLSFQKIEMEADSVRNPEHANRIEKLTFTANVQSDEPVSPQQAEKIANLVVNNCGMIQSVIHSIEINFIIKFGSPISEQK
ncbi:OsmC family protein [Neobacillus mesonae]|uniref:OsmC family protein n=1 Tax=Neobacillus mesonae TaxID=1193713 RepID=UPI00203AA224|nr:OsmC family protein [Neobacillus mesonae]MCM3571250.1 OsmC family protein [Neobacillus mesonae]